MVEHRSAESEDLRFNSSWGLRIFSLSHARDKTKNIFLYFFTELRTYHLSYSIYLPCFKSFSRKRHIVEPVLSGHLRGMVGRTPFFAIIGRLMHKNRLELQSTVISVGKHELNFAWKIILSLIRVVPLEVIVQYRWGIIETGSRNLTKGRPPSLNRGDRFWYRWK